MVWKLRTKCKQTLWCHKPQNQILRNLNWQTITAKSRATTETSVVNSRKRETELTPTKTVPVTKIIEIITLVKQTLTPTTTKPSVMAMPTVQASEEKENQGLSTQPVKLVAKRTTPERNAILEPMQQTDRLLAIEDRWNKIKINNKTHRSIKLKVSGLRPKL